MLFYLFVTQHFVNSELLNGKMIINDDFRKNTDRSMMTWKEYRLKLSHVNTIPVFVMRGWEKPWKTSVMINDPWTRLEPGPLWL